MIWFILAIIVFILLSIFGSEFFLEGERMFLAFILILIAFVVTLVGMAIYSGLLNIMFNEDYYDFGKMFGFSVLANAFLVLIFLPIYLMMRENIQLLLFVYAFHIMFAFFISYTLIEFTTNPSYSSSNLIGTVLWFGIALIAYMGIYAVTMGYGEVADNISKEVSKNVMVNVTENISEKKVEIGKNSLYLFVLSPLLISYIFVPLLHWAWGMIYFMIYSGGSNPLFVPQPEDISIEEDEEDEVNVEIS